MIARWPTDRPCEDCGSRVAVWWYQDPDSRGVHSCALCEGCTTRQSTHVSNGQRMSRPDGGVA